MKYKKFSLIFLLLVFISGCGTTYVYYGLFEEENSAGEEREHLIYWTKTVRPFWFDECDGSMRLLTGCSYETILFDETEDGIVFRCTPYHIGVTHTVEAGGLCGEILNTKKIGELAEGKLMLKIYCAYNYDEFTEGDHSYLQAQEDVYEIDIKRKKISEFGGNVPKRPECSE